MRLDSIERSQGGGPQGSDDWRFDQGELGFQMRVAIENLDFVWRSVTISRVARITEDDVGDKDPVASQPGRSEQSVEVLAGPIGRERNAAPITAESSRSLGNEKNQCINWSIMFAKHAAAPRHARTTLAARYELDETGEGLGTGRARVR